MTGDLQADDGYALGLARGVVASGSGSGNGARQVRDWERPWDPDRAMRWAGGSVVDISEADGQEALVNAQSTTPVWYVLHPARWEREGGDPSGLVCKTQQDFRILGIPVEGGCNAAADVDIVITCRSCGEQRFTVCRDDFDELSDGVEHVKPWCVYCTEAVARHEVVAITTLK